MAPATGPSLRAIGKLPPQLRATLEGAGYALVEHDGQIAPDFAVAVTTSIDGANAATMSQLPDLKLIACNGAGLDAIDLAEAERRGVAVRNTPDAVTQDTAEFAVGLIFAVGRRILEADAFVRSGAWSNGKMAVGRRLAGRTVGIVGMGRIGQAIAARVAALGMPVRYTARSPRADVAYRYEADVGALAEASDILVLALSAGPEANAMIDADVLRRLGPSGLLINVARGSVVDETALIATLRERRIGGAGLDVFAHEPGLDAAFLELDNVVLSPHYASVTEETRGDIAAAILDAVDDFYGRR
jgi:hydroxypyruvate reductase